MFTDGKAEIVSISAKPRDIGEIVSLLEREMLIGGDLFLLPEACLGLDQNTLVVRTDGPEAAQISALAAKYRAYVVFPVFREGGRTGRLNSSLLFGRDGELICAYDKLFPFWGEYDMSPPVDPGKSVCVADTDFGRVGLAVCFDANFTPVFKGLAEAGARLVLWSSAYSGGTSLKAHAINHNYMVITSTLVPDCVVYDINGDEIFYRSGEGDEVVVCRHSVDLDRCVFHEDYNVGKIEKLLADRPGEIEIESWLKREKFITVRSLKDGVSVRALAAEYGIEELPAYKLRSERAIDEMRGFKI